MSYLIELPVAGSDESAQIVRIEVKHVADGLVKVSRPGQVVAKATRTLTEMLADVRPIAETFVQSFADMVQPPDEITVEFGLSLSAEAELIVSSTTAQANFTVSLAWRPGLARESRLSRNGAEA